MKTPSHDRRVVSQNQDASAKQRRRRTLAAFDCESLEGRKLMTGFNGAAAMTGGGTAELAGLGAGGLRGNNAAQFPNGSGNLAALGGQQTAPGQGGMAAYAHFTPGQSGGMAGLGGGMNGFDGDRNGRSFGGHDYENEMGADQADHGAMNDPMNGRFDPTSPGQSATGNTQSQADLTKLRTDQQATHDKSQVTPALLASVRKDFAAIDQAKTGTADATALKTLQTDQQTIFATHTAPSAAQQSQLQADHAAVLKSQGVPQTLIDQLAADQLAVKTASNVTAADLATLDADRAVVAKDQAAFAPNGNPTDTAATAPASTPTTTPATPPPATQMLAQATPAGTSTPAAASTTASTTVPAEPPATPSDPIDPRLMQTTSTPAPMPMITPPFAGRHRGMNPVPAAIAHQGGFGQQSPPMTRFAGHFRRGRHA